MKLLVPMEDFSHAPSKLTSSPEGLPPPPALYHPPFLTALLLWALFCSSGVSTNTFSPSPPILPGGLIFIQEIVLIIA